jgi:hypothetical protein
MLLSTILAQESNGSISVWGVCVGAAVFVYSGTAVGRGESVNANVGEEVTTFCGVQAVIKIMRMSRVAGKDFISHSFLVAITPDPRSLNQLVQPLWSALVSIWYGRGRKRAVAGRNDHPCNG